MKIRRADLAAGNMRGDSQYRCITAVAIKESVDQVQIPGATTSRAHCQIPAQLRFRAGGEGRNLFVAHGNPFNSFGAPNRIHDAIQGVAHHAINSLYARRHQHLD